MKYKAMVGFPAVVADVYHLLGVRAGPETFDKWLCHVPERMIELTPRAGGNHSPERKVRMQHTRAFTTEAALDNLPDLDNKLRALGFECPPDHRRKRGDK